MTNSKTTPQAVQTQWKLTLEETVGNEQTFLITGDTVTLGRDLSCDIVLDDLHISKTHARLTQQGDQLIIEDLSSINGTIVNAGPLTGPYTLRPDDAIKIGSFTFVVKKSLSHLPQSRIKTSVHTVASKITPREAVAPEPPRQAGWLIGLGLVVALLLLGVTAFLLGWLGVTEEPTVADVTPISGTVALDVPTLTISRPPTETVSVGDVVQLEAFAADSAGMRRIELWAEGQKVDEAGTATTGQIDSLRAPLTWTPDEPGTYTLEVRAYNRSGLASRQSVGPLIVVSVDETATPLSIETPAPTLTNIPTTPAATPTELPDDAVLVVAGAPLTVRSGPKRSYTEVTQLTIGDEAEILSQVETEGELWWQIRYTAGESRYLGWILADPDLTVEVEATPSPTATSPPTATPTRRPTRTPTASPTPPPPPTATPTLQFLRAPDGQTLVIVSNRSLDNQPARLTLSGGKSVGGGREIDVPAGQEAQITLEPDEYQGMWSSTARSGFASGMDFTAIAGKVMVMWIVPEEGRTETEIYDQLVVNPPPQPVVTALPSATPDPIIDHVAPPGRALIVVANRSMANANANLTLSGGSFRGGESFVLDANTETALEMTAGSYRSVWNLPIRQGMFLGNEFDISAGEVVLFWIVPEDGTLFMQRPGQDPVQINN